MVNFNPYETTTLTNLLAALQGGLDPSQGYSILSDVIATQQERAATRKANLQQLAATLEGTATMYPDRRSAMTQVNAWDAANMVGPNQVGTLRDTVRALYPDGRGTPSPLFDYSNLPASASAGSSLADLQFGDAPSSEQIYQLNQRYNEPALPEMYTPQQDLFNPLEVRQVAMDAAGMLVESGVVPTPDLIFGIIAQDPSTAQYVSMYGANARAIATLAAEAYSNPATLGMVSGAG
jgi:hypothetical protein